jgi:hypothetical protein
MMEKYGKRKVETKTVCNTARAFPKRNPDVLGAALLISVEKQATPSSPPPGSAVVGAPLVSTGYGIFHRTAPASTALSFLSGSNCTFFTPWDESKAPLLSDRPEKRTTQREIYYSERNSLVEDSCRNSAETGEISRS